MLTDRMSQTSIYIHCMTAVNLLCIVMTFIYIWYMVHVNYTLQQLLYFCIYIWYMVHLNYIVHTPTTLEKDYI